MNFIDYGDNRIACKDIIKDVNKNKIIKTIRLVTLALSLAIPLFYMVLMIIFKWDTSKLSFTIWINGKVDFKLWLMTTLIFLFCSYFIRTIFYSILITIILFVIEFRQVVYIALHTCSVVMAILFSAPFANWFISFKAYDSSLYSRSEFWLKIILGFLLWALVQCFIRILIFPFIRGSFENNMSKVCSVITIIGMATILFGGKTFDFSSIVADFNLTSEKIEPIVAQILCAFLFLLFMSYIHACMRFPHEALKLHKTVILFLFALFNIVITIVAMLAIPSSSSEVEYVDSNGNKYDKYKKRIP